MKIQQYFVLYVLITIQSEEHRNIGMYLEEPTKQGMYHVSAITSLSLGRLTECTVQIDFVKISKDI